jgi:hypothetical protein
MQTQSYLIFQLSNKKKFKFKISDYAGAARLLKAFAQNGNKPRRAFIVWKAPSGKTRYMELNLPPFWLGLPLIPFLGNGCIKYR